MSCLTSEQITERQAELAAKEAQLAALDTAIAAGTTEIESYTLDTGEARQSQKFKSITELIHARDLVQSQVNRLRNILRGTGLMNMNLRR